MPPFQLDRSEWKGGTVVCLFRTERSEYEKGEPLGQDPDAQAFIYSSVSKKFDKISMLINVKIYLTLIGSAHAHRHLLEQNFVQSAAGMTAIS